MPILKLTEKQMERYGIDAYASHAKLVYKKMSIIRKKLGLFMIFEINGVQYPKIVKFSVKKRKRYWKYNVFNIRKR